MLKRIESSLNCRAIKTISLMLITVIFLSSCTAESDNSIKNQAPIFTSSANFSVLDDILYTGYQAKAIDDDLDSITYSISGGTDQSRFVIDSTSGKLSFKSRPNFSIPQDKNRDNEYEIEISATDDNQAIARLNFKLSILGQNVFLRIPIVVHVLYQDTPTDESNISNEKILSQIAVLNKDYRKNNSDLSNTPTEFKSVIADINIEFEMASVDPNGLPTQGVTRTQDLTYGDSSKIPFSDQGGKDAWPTDQYLNIWLIDGANRHGKVRVAGRGQFPGGDPLTDGVIVAYQAFGTIAPLAFSQELHLGRTTTHEIGHWLNLRHIDGGYSCEKDDGVSDTPLTSTGFSKHPSYPMYSCGSSDMFMNFMTPSVADNELLMFTQGQKDRIHAVFLPNGGRHNLYNNLRK